MRLVDRNSFLLQCLSLMVLLRETEATDDTKGNMREVHVGISNHLPNGTSFTIHCKSKDDDLGSHVIGSGQTYGFSFKVNFFHTTLFFCETWWQGGNVVFDIYRASRDDWKRCTDECLWQAREDGVMGFNFIGTVPNPDIVIPWKKR